MTDQLRKLSDRDIIDVVRGVKFGSVEITIHDNKVVQVERKEKWRSVDVRPLSNKEGQKNP